MNDSMKDPRAWVEVNPELIILPTQRSAANLLAAAKQFEVETNPRYVAGHDNDPATGKETYCNIFLWDFTKAMSCEIPHWVDPATGVEVPMGKGKENSANGLCDWMAQHGLENSWMICSEKQARVRATAGFPTVCCWKNAGGIGHVSAIMPGLDFTHSTQAGGTNFFDKNLRSGFGNAGPLIFYTHD